MSKKINNDYDSCGRFSKQFKSASCVGSDKKLSSKVVIPKKVLTSKKLSSSTLEGKSCSTGVISCNKGCSTKKTKKTTKSDASFCKKNILDSVECCKKCGDFIDKQSDTTRKEERHAKTKSTRTTTVNTSTSQSITIDNKTDRIAPNPIQQYYKNENFCQSTESINATEHCRRISSLGTIKEVPEFRTSEEEIVRICSDQESEDGFLDIDNHNVIKSLKEFRDKNYFECHSAKSRIKGKANVTSLQNHKCVYRFYLNERLFPVALNKDFSNTIRCVECNLPMELRNEESDKINGTIQAKVKLGDEVKDLMLLLPAKEPLILKEKRKEEKAEEHEEVYFGIIKLSCAGQSVFNNATFNESYALRYQRGYRLFESGRMSYKHIEDNDVVFI